MADLLDPLSLARLREVLAGRYQLEQQIGAGGTAAVYLARDVRHGRRVALKVLRAGRSGPLGIERFLREIRVVANLQHPHILPLFDSGHADDLVYYVMPFVDGESLRSRLGRDPPLALAEILWITRSAAEALAAANEQGVIHCDVKPENILLGKGQALVADFGIARAVGTGPEADTGQPGVAGTPRYMSPEQALGDTELDDRSDVYSLGCVLYEMLSGRAPFEGETPTAIVARQSLEEVPSLEHPAVPVPETVRMVLSRALARRREDRARMWELAEMLRGEEARLRQGRHAAAARWRTLALPASLFSALLVWAGLWGAHYLSHRRAAEQDSAAVATGAALDPRHIAVLYFQQRTGQDSLTYLADGLTEELIHELSRVRALRVISPNGVSPYRQTGTPPESIARALRVGTLVQGTLAQSDDRLRVNVSLIDGGTGTELASTAVERPHQELFALQEDLAKEVAIFLRRRLGEAVERKTAETRARNHKPRAWHLYQQAEELTRDLDTLLAAGDTNGVAERLSRADSLLVQAQKVEPDWSRPSIARGRLAFSRLDLIGTFDKDYYRGWTAAGIAYAERALRLQPGDPEALALRGSLRYYQWVLNLAGSPTAAGALLSQAEADLQTAVAADPTAASAWAILSHLRMSQSQPAQAKLAALHAYEADPYLSSAKQTLWRLFQSSLDMEDPLEASRWCQEGQRRFPTYYRFTECQLWMYALAGQRPDLARAEQLYRRYVELSPPTAREFHQHYGQMLMAIALARAGRRDTADAVARRARADSSLDATRDLAQLEAIARTIMGERDEALRLLGTYLEANPQFRDGMRRDRSWWFRPLRDDPRYGEMVAARQEAPTH